MSDELISRSDAIRLAHDVAETESWTWLEPVTAKLVQAEAGGWQWNVCSNAGCRGTNVRVVINAATGQVLEKAFLPK